MGQSLTFKKQVKTKSGLFEILLVANKAEPTRFKKSREGALVFGDGSRVIGMESYSDFLRTRDKHFMIRRFEVKFNGRLIPLNPKEWSGIVVSTLRPSADPEQREEGVKVISDVAPDRIRVVLAGGDGAASFILTWQFSHTKGFMGRKLQGPA